MRNTGRTKAMVMDLPATGSIVVVHTGAMRDYVRQMIADLRGEDVLNATRIALIYDQSSAHYYLTGGRLPVVIDHAFHDSGSRPSHHVIATVDRLAAGCNMAANYQNGV